MFMFSFLLISYQVIIEQCGVIEEGLVLTEYYQKWCPACQKLDPLLQELDNRIERNEIDFRIQKVDCTDCECDKNEIKSYPTAILRNFGKEVARFTGYKTWTELTDFITSHTSINKEIFEDFVKAEEEKLHELSSSEMYQGLDGPWIIYFYYKDSSPFENLMLQLQKIYGEKINFAKISYNESKDFITQLNIKSYPAFYGIFNGLSVPYLESLSLDAFSKFCDKLIEPSFKNLKFEEFKLQASLLDFGEPLYLVFYNDLIVANQYFAEYAHKYKYKAKIFKTDDKKLFDIAAIHPTSSKDHDSIDNKIKFGVYKNGRFYEYRGDISNEDEVAAWIFHTHFKYVTEIRNSTFSSIFNGFKPAMILLTQGEELLTEFNHFSADRHLGSPYIDLLFASLDTSIYPNFIPTLLPNLPVPSLIMYDPVKKLFRNKKFTLSKTNFHEKAMETLKLYEKGKLELYPRLKTYKRYYILGLGMLIGLFLLCFTKYTKQTNIKMK